ncbi:MAG: hypothetical protein JNK69_16180 [Saprospiraceae bacterium]|nr:hypothetical protein [Saprospiraceae bacterium]MCC6841759.1 hypothetical protein [Saprospiraceae bacterium]
MSVGPDKKLLIRYVMNSCSPEERMFVEEWRNSDPDIQKELDHLRLIYLVETNPNIISKKISSNSKRFYLLVIFLLMLLLIMGYIFYQKN